MTEKAGRRRRIVRGAVLATTGVVLLPASYLGSVACLAYAVHARLVPAWVEKSAATSVYVAPVVWYMQSAGLPGSDLCEGVMLWCCEAGERARD
jgi:hypothetical protein